MFQISLATVRWGV